MSQTNSTQSYIKTVDEITIPCPGSIEFDIIESGQDDPNIPNFCKDRLMTIRGELKDGSRFRIRARGNFMLTCETYDKKSKTFKNLYAEGKPCEDTPEEDTHEEEEVKNEEN